MDAPRRPGAQHGGARAGEKHRCLAPPSAPPQASPVSRAGQFCGRLLVVGLLVVALLAGASGCRRKKPVAKVPPPAPPAAGEAETGLASWYGHPYHGRPTSSGEIYDMNKMTAAHRTLPHQTWVRVTNLENGRTTEVRINDRGPFIEGRIIDLSRAAAEAIEMLGPGTALVRLEIIRSPSESAAAPRYTVQVGAFQVVANANRLKEQLAERYRDVFVEVYDAPDTLYYRVRVGRVASLSEAHRLAAELRQLPDIAATFVVRVD
ncbi:MAG: septal ring lytic transglycosylase RlpA family protein [Acidobacteria bacterium]|nr:septal ring lytic transglycosylase RlpA family protein [Acidobacteriota bacterium]